MPKSDTDGDVYSNRDGNCDIYSDGYRHSYGDGNCHVYSDSYRNSNVYRDRYSIERMVDAFLGALHVHDVRAPS